MLQVRSPYYINSRTLTINEVQVNIDLYVWSGDKVSDKPVDPNYQFEMVKPVKEITILSKNISPMIRDFFLNETVSYFTTTQLQQNQTVWTQWDVTIIDNTGSEVDTTSSDVIDAVEGYTNYMDNVNYQPTTDGKILISSNNKKIWNQGIAVIPINITGIDTIEYGPDGATTSIDVSTIDLDQSENQIYYLNVTIPNAETITVKTIEAATKVEDEKVFNVVCENIFDPINIIFKNKLGVYENIYLFKKPQKSIKNKSEMFKTGVSNGQTYETSKGQYQKYNLQGKETIKAMTGYVPETFNQTMEELLMSEKVFIQTDTELKPVNVKTENLEFLTQLVDQKINYEIEFEYAFDKINTM